MVDPSLTAITYALGGLTVSAVAVAGGLRLMTFRRALALQLAMSGREVPAEVSFYLGFSAKALHFTAGWFCITVLADMALSRVAPNAVLAAVGGCVSAAGIFACGLMLLVLAGADFKVKVNRLPYRVMQVVAGGAGIGIAVLGVIAIVRWGRLWQTPMT